MLTVPKLHVDSEAIELRENGILCSIIILGICTEDAVEKIIEYDIEPAVSSVDFARKLNDAAIKSGKIAKIHIALDTGMGRIEFMPYERSIDEIIELDKFYRAGKRN